MKLVSENLSRIRGEGHKAIKLISLPTLFIRALKGAKNIGKF